MPACSHTRGTVKWELKEAEIGTLHIQLKVVDSVAADLGITSLASGRTARSGIPRLSTGK